MSQRNIFASGVRFLAKLIIACAVRSVGTKETNLKTSFSLANAFIDSFCVSSSPSVISIIGIIIVSCDRLLERIGVHHIRCTGTRAIKAFAQTPSQCFRREDWPARLLARLAEE